MSAYLRRNGKWDNNAPTNRKLIHYDDVREAFEDADRWSEKRKHQRKPKPIPLPIAPHNIINSISDKIPTSKLTEGTRTKFKGKTFEYMANNHPELLKTFLEERKELCFPKNVLVELIIIAEKQIADNQTRK